MKNKKLLLMSVIVLIVFSGCKKFSYQFLEEPAPAQKMDFYYFKEVVEEPDHILKLNDQFFKNSLKASNRSSYDKYSKIYFDSSKSVVKVENYRKDSFNSHLYYPYLVYVVSKKSQDVIVTEIKKAWKDKKLVKTSVVMRNITKNETGKSFDDLVSAFKTGVVAQSYLDVQYEFSFIPANTVANRKYYRQVDIYDPYYDINGTSPAVQKIAIKIRFSTDEFQDYNAMTLGQVNKVVARLRKTSSGFLEFTFIRFANAKVKNSEKKK